jgi:hypothetical protein
MWLILANTYGKITYDYKLLNFEDGKRAAEGNVAYVPTPPKLAVDLPKDFQSTQLPIATVY